jgi:transcriptional regulator with XRE-family HTH domain
MPARSPDPLDKLIGENIRFYRLRRRMSQAELGKRLGLTFQQIQKYERGANRIPGSRLIRIARILEVPIGSFFGEGNTDADRHARSPLTLAAERQASRLIEAFSAIADTKLRTLLVQLVEDIATSRNKGQE